MKKRFTILAAAFALLTFLVPLTGWGQAPVNTTLWEETWTDGAANTTPSAYNFSGTTVYGDATLTYAQSSTATKLYAEVLAGGSSPELLLSKSNQTWTISNIPTGQATKMALTFLSNKTTFDVTSTTSGITITGSQKSWIINATIGVTSFDLTIKNTGSQNARLDDILLKVTIAGTDASTVATPSISPESGNFLESQEVSITCATEGATIYYTTNGNDPTTSSSVYSASFTIDATTAVKAFAVKSGMNNSAIASATFTKVDPMTVAEARAAIDAGTGTQDVYVTGTVSGIVDAWNTQYNNISFNMSNDGLTTSDQLEAFRCVSTDNANASEVGVGDVVVVHGNLTLYNSTVYEFTAGCQLVSLTHPAGTIATPTFNPEGGTYTEAQTVTISCATANTTIYYTTDGTDPDDESAQYTSPITVSETMTIKAIAYDNNDNASAIATANYVINLPLPTQTFSQIDGHNPVEGQTYLIVDLTSGRALTSANGSSSSPTAVEVIVTNGQITTNNAELQWTFEATDGGYIIHPLGDNTKWLYTTDANNGVRVGTNENKVWTLDVTDATNTDYLGFKNNATSRYLGVYNNQDWRAYGSVNNNIKDTQIALFVLGNAPAPAPSFTIENNNEIAYDATSGSFNFTVNNPVEGGVTSVAEDVDWISNAAISGNSITFTTTVNEAATSRADVITLTYTYNSATVTKNVTVTQAGNPNATLMTIAEVRAQGTGSVVTTGIVTSCVGTTGYIQDATAAICVYGAELTIGDEIRVSGTLNTYRGLLEITSPQVTVVSSGNTVTPIVKTIAEINADDYTSSTSIQGLYVTIENAKVTVINGQNTTIAQGDNTIVVRGISSDVTYALNDILTLDGNIGCFDAAQIANPQNVEVQPNTEPSINIPNATFNVPAVGAEGTVAVDYQNFTELAATIYFCNAAGTEAVNYDWIEAEVNDDDNIDYTVSANNGEARTAYLKVYDSNTNTYSNLVTINQEAAPTVATLPFTYDGNGLGELPDGLTQHGLTGKYDNSPKMKFDDTGDWLLLQFNERPGTLTFNIKNNSFSGGTFTVQTSEDGVTYTDLAVYTEIIGTQDEEFNNLGENVRYIKWIYTNKASGNVGLGNIALQPYVAPQEYTLTVSGLNNVELYVFDASDENQAIIEGEGSAQVLNGTTIEISVSAIDGCVLQSLMVDGENVISQIDETGLYTFTMPTHDVTITATAIEYVAGNYVRISDLNQLTDGCKVIIAARHNTTADSYYAMKNATSGKPEGTLFTSVTSGNDEAVASTITDDEDNYYWTVNVTENGYTFTNASDQMIGYGSNTNFATGNNTEWTIERGEAGNNTMVPGYEGFVIKNGTTTTRAFAFNGSAFGAYATTNMTAAGYNFFLDFFVQTEASETVTQTIELAAGWNWFSTYVEGDAVELLQAIENGLGDKGITIKGSEISTDYYGEEYGWFGELDALGIVNEQMYLINVSESCTVELQGTPANPANHTITINPGWNWIGFPCAEAVSVAAALAGFEAEEGDVLKGSELSTDYYGEEFGWFGGLETLEPGQGYLYKYNGTTPQTLTFRVSARKADDKK